MKKIERIIALIFITGFAILLSSCNGNASPTLSTAPVPTLSSTPVPKLSATPIPTSTLTPTSPPSPTLSPSPSPSESPAVLITPVPLIALNYAKVVPPADMASVTGNGFTVTEDGTDVRTVITWDAPMGGKEGLVFLSYSEQGKDYAEIMYPDSDGMPGELPVISRQLAIVSPRAPLSREQVDDTSKLKVFDAGKYSVEGKSPYRLREGCIPYLFEMFAAAEKAGIKDIKIRDTFRGFEQQTDMFNWAVEQRLALGIGYNEAFRLCDRETAYPGTSEHHDGFTADIINGTLKLEQGFGNTEFGKWLAANSYKYGFIIRYPSGKEAQTTKFYEPWHVRFVGPQAAAVIHKYGITLEEFHAYLDINHYLISSYGDGKLCVFMNVSSLDGISIQEGLSESGDLLISERGDGGYLIQFSIR
jgi:LAS superfamily LD-carboxypeptidase LdcB